MLPILMDFQKRVKISFEIIQQEEALNSLNEHFIFVKG